MAASRDEVFERIKEVLAERLSVEEADINEEANFQEDLDADSLDLVEMIMELEDQFGIKIPDDPDGRASCRLRHVAPVAERRRGSPHDWRR
jgi:acyl carrier protein